MLGEQADVSAEQPRKKRAQSRVTAAAAKGLTTWMDKGDRRGPVARRFRDLCSLLTSDLGGLEVLSEGQRQNIRRVASMACWCESMEAKMADGEEVNMDQFLRTANSMRRIIESLGIDRGRLMHDQTETWDAYLARTAREKAQDGEGSSNA